MDDIQDTTLKMRTISHLLKEVSPRLEAHFAASSEVSPELHEEIRTLKRELRAVCDTHKQNSQPPAKKSRTDDALSKALRPFHIALQPTELIKDVFALLDRWTLDGLQFGCGRFRRVVNESMSDLCLRQLAFVRFSVNQGIEKNEADQPVDSEDQDAVNQEDQTDAVGTSAAPAAIKRAKETPKSIYAVKFYYERPSPSAVQCQAELDEESVKKHRHFESRAEALEYFAGIIRSARIERLNLEGMFCERTFIEVFSALSPTVAIGRLDMGKCVFGQYREEFVRCILRLQALGRLDESRRCLIDDHSLACFAAKGVILVKAAKERSPIVPHELTDEGILAFLYRETHPKAGRVTLELPGASLSPLFCKNLIERGLTSPSQHPVLLKICDIELVGQDLSDYEHIRRQLSRYRGYRDVVLYENLGNRERCMHLGFKRRPDYDDGRFKLEFVRRQGSRRK